MAIKSNKKKDPPVVEEQEETVQPEEDLEPIGSDDDWEDDDSEDATEQAKKSRNALSALNHNDLFADFDPDEEDDIEAQFDDPRVTRLDDSPLGGSRFGNSTSMFGNSARSVGGRATSPRLMASAANMPNTTQLRIWKWENGVPVGLGAIDAQASEEDLVREFFDAMPKKGEGRCQFKLRPIDINGNEQGTEINCIISEHHAAIQKIKRIKEAEREEEMGYRGGRHAMGRGGFEWDEEDSVGSSPGIDSLIAPQMDRMMNASERRMELLEKQLEIEREEIRRREELRMQEQVDMATNAAQGVQVLTERMMQDESKRSERAMQMQTEQSQTLITTLTSIFAQQQSMLNAQMEQQRRQDEYRLEQERQRAQRERDEERSRRERERLELEERRLREREEYERRMREERENIERKMAAEQRSVEMRLQREREEMQLRVLRDKEEREARERWFAEERLRREAQEREDAKQKQSERQRQHERMMRELELQQQKDREHAERMMILSKQELTNKAMGGLGEMLPMATGILGKMGLEPMDVVQKIFAPEKEETSAWSDTLPKILGAGADIARNVLGGGAAPVPPIAMGQPMPQIPMQPDFGEIDYRQGMERMRQPVPQFDDEPLGNPDYDEPQVIRYQDMQPQPQGQGQGQGQPTQQKQSEPIILPQQPPKSNMDLASQAGMTLAEQRDARNGLGQLVGQLHGSDQANWEGLITQGLMSEPQIFSYIQAVSVRSAIRETGADNQLTENIVRALQQSPLVPSDINYGV